MICAAGREPVSATRLYNVVRGARQLARSTFRQSTLKCFLSKAP